MIPAIMFQGTGSDVGKSLIVAGLARAFTARGLKVRPFKPQNMSNNAAVTADGGEIGRAQALQARAARVPLSVHMNPVLLKPQSDVGSQVIVQGRIHGNARARDYHALKPRLMQAVLDSFHRLEAESDLVLVEGAGSPAEINLRAGDIANMGFAEAADLPVVLVGDIDRGGVIASIIGTLALLPANEAARIKGFLINKFRGDPVLFAEGLKLIAEKSGKPSLGLVPWFAGAERLPPEDGVALDNFRAAHGRAIRIAVLHLPRISNFDDLDPLRAEPDVTIELLRPGQALPGDVDLVLLPGSKATIADLRVLYEAGWDIDIRAHLRRGGKVLGLCGGYQMLGKRIEDPTGIEGPKGGIDGLGLLDIVTTLTPAKTLVEVSGEAPSFAAAIRGYEMHVGQSEGADTARPLLKLGNRFDGAISADGRVLGCYVHGLFAADPFRHAFLNALKARGESGVAYEAGVEQALDDLAAHLEQYADLDRILEMARAR
ncbi:adenosylcobyric acid synthase (glutamine-hydrolysing) [Dongia mobilis]|uniref:Cobyric acid synthase n=1 Tax=Dongia mobilis TaxID=578943 RepID=A0A4R6X2U0_9PROT|nr:cobyric acid synthase [Dongia mobilis]TDQ86412.1 adenosylcobyric acid synthase (glutamine-hydrolysing) [Dongia mobilis]